MDILAQEGAMFDNDFLIIESNEKGEAVFFMPPGQENKIMEKAWYLLGILGYFDIPYCKADVRMELLESFPDELRVMVFRRLFFLNTPIHIFLDSSPNHPCVYKFFVRGAHDFQHILPLSEHGGQLGPFENLFAITQVDSTTRALVREIFYGENTFVFGPFPNLDGAPKKGVQQLHFRNWMRLIGAQARGFIKQRSRQNCSFG